MSSLVFPKIKCGFTLSLVAPVHLEFSSSDFKKSTLLPLQFLVECSVIETKKIIYVHLFSCLKLIESLGTPTLCAGAPVQPEYKVREEPCRVISFFMLSYIWLSQIIR